MQGVGHSTRTSASVYEEWREDPLSDSVSSYCSISCSIAILTPFNVVVHANDLPAVGVFILSVAAALRAAGETEVRRLRRLETNKHWRSKTCYSRFVDFGRHTRCTRHLFHLRHTFGILVIFSIVSRFAISLLCLSAQLHLQNYCI
jgi:hypothetical protein